MKKNKFNIAALFLLFVFLAGSVGVNVNRTYCNHCHIYRWQVFFVSFDDDGTDLQFCSCCHTCESWQASPCENAEDDYGYYKIKSVYSTSNHYPHFGDLTALPVFVPSCGAEATLVSNQFISVPSYTDTSPPQEVLCTFRC